MQKFYYSFTTARGKKMASIYRKKGNDVWYYCITYSGKKYQGCTKTTDKLSAKLIAEAKQTDIAREKNDLPALKKTVVNFPTVWREYYKRLANEPATLISKNDAAKHLLPIFENKNIAGISQTDIENYRLKRKLEILSMNKNVGKKESEINFRTVNLEISTLHHFFNYCIKHNYIDKNPATGIKKLNELSRLKTLSDEDIQKLIAGATNKLTKDLITFLIYTGCRKGEALNLKWDDVDLQNDVIAIKGTKTKYDRYIPISKPLKELLKGIEKKQDCLYVFNDNGRKLGDFKKSFHTACRNAGLKDLRIHDLRHVFASKMVMNGTSLYITGELLGHRTTQMTKRYSHLVPDTLKKAVDDVWGKIR
jgi:integrase